MTLNVDLYYTMRSPYCYLSTPQLERLVKEYDIEIHLKPVFPLAVSDSTFFEKVNPLWPPYLLKDTARIAERLSIPFHWPRPDPIVQDMKTRKVSKDQPYIRRLTCLAQVAAERGQGLDYVIAASALLFSPEVDGWHTGTQLSDALVKKELVLSELEEVVNNETERLEVAIHANRAAQLAAGHWGAPLFVFNSEIFFGRDRIEDLVWLLKKNGLKPRT
ncbi:MAG: DsbA family protein [Pseudomonadales bacterium]